MIRTLLVALVAFALAAPVAAQPAPPTPPAANAQRREAIKKRIRAMRAYTLTEELQLDDRTSAKLFPALARWDDVTDKLLAQRVDLTRKLKDPNLDPRTLDKVIDDAIANQRAFWDLEEKRLAELRKILTPQQTARILIVLPAFERKIQNQLKRAIQKQQRPKRPARIPDDVDDDGDDDIEPGDLPAPQPPRPGPAKRQPIPNPY